MFCQTHQCAGRLAVSALALTLLSACAATAPTGRTTAEPGATASATNSAFVQLEGAYQAKLGVWAVDTGTGRTVGWRADERFPYASTYKALAAAAVLRQASPALDETIHFTRADVVTYSPVTEQHVDSGMTLREVCEAAVTKSDNTAGNLLLARLGGPAGFTAALRAAGDPTTRSDRTETDLNEAVPNDPRDTGTPHQLALDLRRFAVDYGLPADRRDLLDGWLRGNTTGAALIRAGAPADPAEIRNASGSRSHNRARRRAFSGSAATRCLPMVAASTATASSSGSGSSIRQAAPSRATRSSMVPRLVTMVALPSPPGNSGLTSAGSAALSSTTRTRRPRVSRWNRRERSAVAAGMSSGPAGRRRTGRPPRRRAVPSRRRSG
ncbi:class A beta-lactamase [Kitasatospora sp. NPDC001159]